MVTAHPAPTGRRRRTRCSRRRDWYVSFAPSGRVESTIQLPRVPAAKPAYTRGYSPSPFQGEQSRQALCGAGARRIVGSPSAACTTPTGSRTVATGRVRRRRTPPVESAVAAHPAPTGRRERTMSSRRRDWYVSFAPSGRISLTIFLPRVPSAMGGLHPWLQPLAPSGRTEIDKRDSPVSFAVAPHAGSFEAHTRGAASGTAAPHEATRLRRGSAPKSRVQSAIGAIRRSTKSIERGKPRRFISLRRRAWTPPPPPCSPCTQWCIPPLTRSALRREVA
jgi:hypothetical protein